MKDHQIKLLRRDREKTAFSIKNDKYEFSPMRFGLKNTRSIFPCVIDNVLRELIGKSCFVYVDDDFSQNKELFGFAKRNKNEEQLER